MLEVYRHPELRAIEVGIVARVIEAGLIVDERADPPECLRVGAGLNPDDLGTVVGEVF